jgi:hypothetical protein
VKGMLPFSDRSLRLLLVMAAVAALFACPLAVADEAEGDIEVLSPAAQQQYDQGQRCLAKAKYSEAIEHFSQVIAQEPRYADAYQRRSQAYRAIELAATVESERDRAHKYFYRDQEKAVELRAQRELAEVVRREMRRRAGPQLLGLPWWIGVLYFWRRQNHAMIWPALVIACCLMIGGVKPGGASNLLGLGALVVLTIALVSMPPGTAKLKKKPFEDHPLEVALVKGTDSKRHDDDSPIESRPCPNCGRSLAVTSRFCPRCDTRVG